VNRATRDLRRPGPRREESRTILVVTEGQTEKEYLEGYRQHLRSLPVSVTTVKVVNGKGEPSKVLRTAQDRSAAGDFDEVWLLMDVDEHARLPEVLGDARGAGFFSAVSNPCFEVWVVWHFGEVRPEVGRRELQQAARRNGVDKSVPGTFPFDRVGEALTRSAGHPAAVNEIGPNPSTAVPSLIEAINAGTRRP